MTEMASDQTEDVVLESDALSADEENLTNLIITTLNLDIDVAEMRPETPIYMDGFGLDSIDILEIALAISQHYGVKLRSDDENNIEIFRNLGSLSAYIQANKDAP